MLQQFSLSFTANVVALVLETDDDEFHYNSFPLKPKFPHPLNGLIGTDAFLLAAQGALRIYGELLWQWRSKKFCLGCCCSTFLPEIVLHITIPV